MIYLDNAATSWPKPAEVLRAMVEVLEQAGGNPGRSGHRLSIAAARVIYDTREEIARFFGVTDPLRVIYTSNVTHSINLIVKGLLCPGDQVVTSSMEHNSVMRPLREAQKRGIKLDIIPCSREGIPDIEIARKTVLPGTTLLLINHASNVVGNIMPVRQLAEIAHNAGALLMLDAAQTAGVVPLNMMEMGVDLLAFTGHKELQGPPGIGGLLMGDKVDVSRIEPLMAGGTGSRSEYEEQPEFLPDKFEGGTPNLPGIAGLGAGLKWINTRSIASIRNHLQRLTARLIEGLSVIKGVRLYGTLDIENSVSVVSFTVADRKVSEIGLALDEEYGILARVGLHCAPAAHRTLGTFPEGTVRLSPGVHTTIGEIDETLRAINRIVKS